MPERPIRCRALRLIFGSFVMGVLLNPVSACNDESRSSSDSGSQTTPDAATEPKQDGLGFQDLGVEPIDAGGSVCVGERRGATLGPLDLVVMLDRSGSMADYASGSLVTKWEAVREAMDQFLVSLSGDVHVSFQYFPLAKPDAAFECSSQADCGSGGPCFLAFCSESGELCAEDLPCPSPDDECLPLGECSAQPFFLCGDVGQSTECDGWGTCLPLEVSVCIDATDCEVAAYSTARVEVQGSADASQLALALDSVEPAGGTPTGPALIGALELAQSQAESGERPAAVVLVTDGVPTECEPLTIEDIASSAEAAREDAAVRTFVIGVLSDLDLEGTENLELIAQAGDGAQAFFIEPSSNLTNRLLLALNGIRASALDCEYELPSPKLGQDFDFDRVNVDFSAPFTEPRRLPYVDQSQDCDSQIGGWYYDDSEAPRAIKLCDAVCGVISSGSGASVEFEVGCETETAILK